MAKDTGTYVATRRERESVVIVLEDGSIVEVKVSRIKGNQVRLAFVAKRDIKILRSEIYKALEKCEE